VFLAQIFLQPGLEAVFSQYCFAVYPIATQMVGATAKVAPALPEDHPMPLGHDLRAMYEHVNGNTRMLFLANPNNPTGTWLEAQRVRDFLASLPGHVICVVDEAYTEYAEGAALGDASTWLEEFPNLVVTRTFSKAYGLAGLRVGYALSNPGIADLMNRVRPAFNVNALALVAAEAALSDDDFIRQTREMNATGMQQLQSGLAALGVTCMPSAANFILARFGRSAAELNENLLQRGIIVRPVANYGLDDALRITIGTQVQNERLLQALEDIL
ncbi:MAG: histidinol-phosphate transaminase, partial [Pseudomonadota bacterium]